jgi:hypothetical protein
MWVKLVVEFSDNIDIADICFDFYRFQVERIAEIKI